MRLVESSNVCSYDGWVVFLVRRDSTDASAAWWHELRRYDSAAPAIIRELLRGPSVVADAIEIRQAVAWARAHPSWRDDDPPLLAKDKATAAGPWRTRRQPHVDVARRGVGSPGPEHASQKPGES